MIDSFPLTNNAKHSDQKLFGRECHVTLYNMRTAQRLDIDRMRIKFQIDKSVGSDPNQSTLEIYNLNATSRAFANIPPLLETPADKKQPVLKGDLGKENKIKVPKDGLFVELSAGYQGMTRIICTGNASGGSEYRSPDWVTKLLISDGYLHLRHAFFEKTYQAGYPVQRVINDVAESFGLPMGYVMPIITTDIVQYGLTLSDQNKKIMDNFASTYGFKWSIQNNAVNIFSTSQPLPEVVYLTPRTGLISTPIRTDKGLEFDCLLIPLITPGCVVKIGGSSTFEGEALVQRVQTTGDTHGADWKMHVEAKLK